MRKTNKTEMRKKHGNKVAKKTTVQFGTGVSFC